MGNEIKNEQPEDSDFDFDDDDESIDNWSCHGCQKYYGKKPTWGQCDICGAYVEYDPI